ncbi:MAG: hypothetical protein AAGE03_15280 [Pseudomonadota bacterium]
MPCAGHNAAQMQRQVADLVAGLSDGSPTLVGWLALDLSEMLLRTAKAQLGGALTPEQQDDLDWITKRLRVLTTEV